MYLTKNEKSVNTVTQSKEDTLKNLNRLVLITRGEQTVKRHDSKLVLLRPFEFDTLTILCESFWREYYLVHKRKNILLNDNYYCLQEFENTKS